MLRAVTLFVLASITTRAQAEEALSPAASAEHATVVLESSTPIDLYRRIEPKGRQPDPPERLCTSPCTVAVPAREDAAYFVAGLSAPPSRAFRLTRPGPVRVAVEPGNDHHRIAGAISVGIGGAEIIAGLTVLLLHLTRDPAVDDFGQPIVEPEDSSWEIGGGCILTAGLASLTVGTVLLATSRTKVERERIADVASWRVRF